MKHKEDERITIGKELHKVFSTLGKLGIEQDYAAYVIFHICGARILDMYGMKWVNDMVNDMVKEVKFAHETQPKTRTQASKKPSPSTPRKGKSRPGKDAA